MISTIRAALLGSYLSSCATSIAISTPNNKLETTHGSNLEVVTTYTGSVTPGSFKNTTYHGIKMGLRTESHLLRLTIDYHQGQPVENSNRIPFSSELSFRGLFREDKSLYEFGLTNGIGFWGKSVDYSFLEIPPVDNNYLEVLIGPARVGIASKEQNEKFYWAPQIGIGYNRWPFQLQAGADFRVGKEKGAGVFVNGGLTF